MSPEQFMSFSSPALPELVEQCWVELGEAPREALGLCPGTCLGWARRRSGCPTSWASPAVTVL